MIFFGHLGLTTGAMKIYEKVSSEKYDIKTKLDYRVILIGSILPDIIDKPIGAGIFRGIFHNSRIFAHTLIFSVSLLLLGGYKLYKSNKNKILLLGISSSIHLILDSMWLFPSILLWPYLGFKFPIRAEGDWLKSDFIRLITDPSYFIPELIGFCIIGYYFIRVIKRKKIKEFILKGEL
ncbi:metal-dependent hydrolase [Clostridium paridis]|uniref:Metal-dependent hydrolase n=1 Tax=Clostridium paridis TaxID=2803863 RepID=A0A937FCP7_9CLOT|nr:metal-dependent hydrolase [Clostridium paridis]MBL4930739.1 metal-dependent hydrolase [Clostridium paridis]